MREASEKFDKMSEEEITKKLEEEENNLNNLNNLNEQENENAIANSNLFRNVDQPSEEDQEQKLLKFKDHLFSEAKKITTPDLLSQIVEIINTTYIDEIKLRNNDEKEYSENEINNINQINLINQTALAQNVNTSESASESAHVDDNSKKQGKYKLMLFLIF
jgi:hypothetical protein